MTHQFTFEGKGRTIFTRSDKPCAPWYLKLRKDGKREWINLGTHVQSYAEQKAKDVLRERRNGDQKKARDFFRVRQPQGLVTLRQVVEAFEKYPGGPNARTRYDYVWSLQKMVEMVHGKAKEWDSHPVEILKEDFVYNYRQAVLQEIEEEEADDLEAQRTMRSGNSIIRQARAMFNPGALEYYRLTAKLELPDLSAFRTSPGFKGATKKEWNCPSDALIQQTLQELEQTRDSHPDRYKVCWLALGFGLRKGEIAAARTDWVMTIEGRVNLELRSVVRKDGSESPVTKNGQAAPRIPVANGAWERLARLKKQPQGHFIEGGKQYRTDDVFRETNAWLRGLGWQTQKGIHELRAYAGCQVINRNGLLAASQWLRHGEIATTQKFYGRYAEIEVTDSPIVIAPKVEAAILPMNTGEISATQLAAQLPTHNNPSTRATRDGLMGFGDTLKQTQTPDSTNDTNASSS
jgi:integrase